MTFENIREIINEFVRQNVGPTEICLVGWNYSGHDGAFPQLFPVEEKFGGEKELLKTIEFSNKAGYPLSLYDNYYDAYSLANNFDPDYIVMQHDGTRALSGKYAGGQAYVLCGKCAYEKYALKSLRQTEALGSKGTYYIDEITLLSPKKCYNKKHLMSRRDNAIWWKKILKEAQRIFGSSHSEGGRDWAFPELDRIYCITASNPNNTAPYIDEHIPFYQMVYHGIAIYNTYRSSVNALPGDNTYLLNLSYGGMPIIYYHHIFNPAWSSADGIHYDFIFGGPEKLKEDTAVIKHITDDISRLSHLSTEFIEGFIRHDSKLTETIYSNGESFYANFSDEQYILPTGEKIPPHDFLIK
jgi:hypothetical protein